MRSMTSSAQFEAAAFRRAQDILQVLVREPSFAGNDAAIERCLEYVAGVISHAGTVELIRYGGPPVLVARFGALDGPAQLVFSGHVDVVPATPDWESAFTLRESDGRLVGRGVVDMKGAVAAFVTALEALGASGSLERCSVEVALTGDEEVGSAHGAIPLAASGTLTARAGVCGEATQLHVAVGSRGVVWLRIVISGRGGHAGFSHQLDNPSSCASKLAVALESLELPARDDRFTPDTPTLTVSRSLPVDGLEAPNVVPDAVALLIDRRLLPAERPEAAIEQIRDCVRATVGPPFTAEIEVLRKWPSYAFSPDVPISRTAGNVLASMGLPAVFETDLAANDSSWLVEAGIPTILLGPGEPEQSHATGESLRSEELATACAVYARLIHTTGGPE
jgi:acetylornithine deacetylase/succinyl-diaminopimelate desuccinylase-like protein